MLLRLVRTQRSASNIGIKGNIYHWHSCGIVVVKGAHHIACLRHRVSRRELELVCYGVIIFITFFGTILLPRVRPSGLTPPSSPKCSPVIQAFKDMQRSVHDGYLTYMKKGAPGLGQGEPARGNRCRVDSEDHPISLRLKLYVLSLVHRIALLNS